MNTTVHYSGKYNDSSIYLQYNLNRCSKKNAVNKVDRSSLRALWENGLYKNKRIEQHKTQIKQDVTDIQNKLFCFGFFFIFILYFRFLKMNSPRNVEFTTWDSQWLSFRGLNQFKAIAIITLSKHLLEKKKETKDHFRSEKKKQEMQKQSDTPQNALNGHDFNVDY